LVDYLGTTSNDLEAPAREAVPVIGEVLDALSAQPGALLSRMSSSGATCFALFEDAEQAQEAATVLRARHNDWWIVPTTTS